MTHCVLALNNSLSEYISRNNCQLNDSFKIGTINYELQVNLCKGKKSRETIGVFEVVSSQQKSPRRID